MAAIKEDYCDFETAKLLKEKGFNEYCPLWYNLDKPIEGPFFYKEIGWYGHNSYDYNGKRIVSAPTLQMAMKWLREVHNIHIELNPVCYGDTEEEIKWHYGWAVKTTIFTDRWKRHNAEHISYEQACEAAIKYCLENLI